MPAVVAPSPSSSSSIGGLSSRENTLSVSVCECVCDGVWSVHISTQRRDTNTAQSPATSEHNKRTRRAHTREMREIHGQKLSGAKRSQGAKWMKVRALQKYACHFNTSLIGTFSVAPSSPSYSSHISTIINGFFFLCGRRFVDRQAKWMQFEASFVDVVVNNTHTRSTSCAHCARIIYHGETSAQMDVYDFQLTLLI